MDRLMSLRVFSCAGRMLGACAVMAWRLLRSNVLRGQALELTDGLPKPTFGLLLLGACCLDFAWIDWTGGGKAQRDSELSSRAGSARGGGGLTSSRAPAMNWQGRALLLLAFLTITTTLSLLTTVLISKRLAPPPLFLFPCTKLSTTLYHYAFALGLRHQALALTHPLRARSPPSSRPQPLPPKPRHHPVRPRSLPPSS